MYFWLIGSINPFLFFFVPRNFRNIKNFFLVIVAGFLSFYSILFLKVQKVPSPYFNLKNNKAFLKPTDISGEEDDALERSPASAHEIKLGISRYDRPYHPNINSTGKLQEWLKSWIAASYRLSNRLIFCLRLSGISGQVQDLVLRFYMFRWIFFCLLLPFGYLVRTMGCRVLGSVKIMRIISFLMTFWVLSQGQHSFGLVRVFLWAGPLAILSVSFGFFGFRSLIFKCVCLSILFPGIFSGKLGLALWIIFFGIFMISNRGLGVVSAFFANNILIAVIFALSSGMFEFHRVFLSPFLELMGVLMNIAQFFSLDAVLNEFIPMALLGVCESKWFYIAVITDKNYIDFLFEVLASFFLLFFCPTYRCFPLSDRERF